jgi:hypothetical protein
VYETEDLTEAPSNELATDVGERVRAIIDSAERAADALLAERRRHIAELSDAIVAHAEAVLGRLEEADALGRRLDEVLGDLRQAGVRLDRDAPRTAPARRFAREGEREDASDDALGARVVALHMAKAGGQRGEVETHMRRAFELDDPQPILDEVFGRAAR